VKELEMLYLHVIDTHDSSMPIKPMFVEDVDAYKIGKLISISEKDNLIIINNVVINQNQRKSTILHIFLNGNEDLDYPEKLKIEKKNN
jgi:hypothetical protein